jgi:hypothetical protein
MLDLDPVLVVVLVLGLVVVDFGLFSNSCQPIPVSEHLTQLD